MQLVEAAILFFVGLIAGVLVTTFDVYTVGAAALLSRVSLWVLLNVLFGANVRDRRTAALGAIPLNLGFVEMYYLTTSYTYAGLSRSLMAPIALLSLVAALVSLLAWTAKSERNLYGFLVSAFVMVGTLVASAITHDGPNAFDWVCVALMAYVLLFMRPRRLALTRRRVERSRAVPAGEGRDAGAEPVDGRLRPAQELASSPRRKPARRRKKASGDEGRGSRSKSRPQRRSGGRSGEGSGRRSASHPAARPAAGKARTEKARRPRTTTSRPASRTEGAGSRTRDSRGTATRGTATRGAAANGAASRGSRRSRTRDDGRDARRTPDGTRAASGSRGGSRGARSTSSGSASSRSGRTTDSQRTRSTESRGTASSRQASRKPTRRTGGPMPMTDVIHTRSRRRR